MFWSGSCFIDLTCVALLFLLSVLCCVDGCVNCVVVVVVGGGGVAVVVVVVVVVVDVLGVFALFLFCFFFENGVIACLSCLWCGVKCLLCS